MVEILPIKQLRDEDAAIFGSQNVSLAKLGRLGLSVANGFIVTAPNLKLKTTLEHFDFGHKEVFEQSLSLVKKELEEIPVPEALEKEAKSEKQFFVNGKATKSVKSLWLLLLGIWLDEVKSRLWRNGFTTGLTEDLTPQAVLYVKKADGFGTAFFDPNLDEVTISIKEGSLSPKHARQISELVELANKKLILPQLYDFILDGELKLTKISPFTPQTVTRLVSPLEVEVQTPNRVVNKAAVKVFFDLSTGLAIENNLDGVFIASEKIADPEEQLFKLVEAATTFPNSQILFKLADISEGMGKVRGALRLIHHKDLLDQLCSAVLFCRNKKSLHNIHLVIPFVRGQAEFMQIKRELAVKKLIRKNNLQIWLEVAVPENIVNIEDYLLAGVDGVILNLDELMAHLNGFDHKEEELSYYKKEITGLLKFLDDGLKILHKSHIPFLAQGTLVLNPEILDFLVEKGVYGVVSERYEAHSMVDHLHNAEKKMIQRRSI
jgi:hypothetical protein